MTVLVCMPDNDSVANASPVPMPIAGVPVVEWVMVTTLVTVELFASSTVKLGCVLVKVLICAAVNLTEVADCTASNCSSPVRAVPAGKLGIVTYAMLSRKS